MAEILNGLRPKPARVASPSADDVDAILAGLNPRGLWQMTSYVVWTIGMMLPECFNILSIIFIGLAPRHHCRVEDNSTIPLDVMSDHSVMSSCSMNDPQNTSLIIPCTDGWTYYDDLHYGPTVVTEWDLVCDSSYLVELTQMFGVLGMAAGYILISTQADRFGRKPVHFIGIAVLCLTMLITAFSYHYMMFLAMRFISGFVIPATAAGFTAAMEMFPSQDRGNAGVLCQFAWMFSMLLLDLMAYFIRDWHLLTLSLALIPLAILPFYFYVSESIPWLIKNGRIRDACDVMYRAAKINKLKDVPSLREFTDVDANDDQYWDQSDEPSSPCRNTVVKMVKIRVLRKHCVIMNAVWFTCSFVYYGISYTSTTWSGDRFVNFLYNALAECPAIIIVLIAIRRFERRTTIGVCLISGGLVLLASTFMQRHLETLGWSGLNIALIIIGKTLACCAFNTAWLYTPELFPTTMRSTGVGVCILGSLAGSLITTLTPYLGRLYPQAPGLAFAISPLLVGPLVMFLPATGTRPLAQTVEEIEEWRDPPCWKLTRCQSIGDDSVFEAASGDVRMNNISQHNNTTTQHI